MFDVSEGHIIESTEEPKRPRGEGDGDVVATLRYNQTDPQLIRDGVDVVEVVDVTDGDGERYRVNYGGYLTGSFVVTRAGVEELGCSLLESDTAVPTWLLSLGDDVEDDPWWVPDGYDPADTVECGRCGGDVGVDEVVMAGPGDADVGETYRCRDCWERGRL